MSTETSKQESVAPCREKWPGTMTDRERFNNQMHYRTVDRSFNMEFGYWNENFELWPIFKDNGITNNDDAHRFFGLDRFDAAGGRLWLSPTFEKRVLAEKNGKQIIMNEEGLLAEIPIDGHDTIPHFVKASVVTPDDWKRCKEERLRLDDPGRIVDVEAIRRRHPDDRDYPLGIACGSMIGKIRDLLTFEGLAYAAYDYCVIRDEPDTQSGMIPDTKSAMKADTESGT